VCGRYAASAGAEEVVETFEVAADLTGGALRPSWNAAPTQQHGVVVERPTAEDAGAAGAAGAPRAAGAAVAEDGAGAGGATVRRELRALTWGLVPSWSKDPSGGARMINARAEGVLERPAYRRAAASRRCLVPAAGWYEWQALPAEPGAPKARGRKQPYFMSLADGGLLAMAGIYEFWRRRGEAAGETPEGEDAWLVTYAVLTREAEPGLSAVHDRMPLVLPPEAWAEWLDPATTAPEQVAAQLDAARSVPPGRFSAVPVSPRVGNVRQDDADLLTPLGPPLPL
jgi:putative SOS response-associated peptidase YedK